MTLTQALGWALPLLLGLCSALPRSAASPAEPPPSPSSCARRYGQLMADHWLTVDLAHQVERAMFHRAQTSGPQRRSGFEPLRQSLASAEQKLVDARNLYKSLFATNSPAGLAQLNELLDQIADAESANERSATGLLQKLGEQSSGPSFQAVPVPKETPPSALSHRAGPRVYSLAAAWDPAQLIDARHRPRRIIFGSTGQAGDDRTLPLRFDFGSGPFNFYAAMASSNRLAVAESLRQQTDPIFAWMRTHQSGYHYWAGVYNNQNTYTAAWFRQQHADDTDVWMKLADGKVFNGGADWGQVNIWNPDVRSYLRAYCETQARTFREDPFLVCYDYTGEPHPWAGQPDGQPQYSGYNDSAIKAFQDYLRGKFRLIQRLNRAWATNYPGFDAIRPPPDRYLSTPPKPSPLTYEFERFRCDSHATVWKLVYDAYRREDPAKPIAANAGMFMSGWPVEGLDAYQLQQAGVADWVDMHMNNFWPNLPEQIYLYSLCRLSGKVPVQFEYIWTFPRTGPFDDNNESDFRATCQASVWRNLVWGKQVLVFFDFYYDWPAYHNAFLDRDLGYSILRPSACVVPVTRRRALRFTDLLLESEVATPPIIVLEPTASILNSPALHPNKSFSFHTEVAGKQVHPLLFSKNYPFLYLPEAAVLGGYSLQPHKVVILPQAPCLPEALTPKLLAWIKQGGTLISLGLPGVWDPYGRDDLRLVREVFGASRVSDRNPGKWNWEWELMRTNRHVLRQLRGPDGHLLATLATYGKGRVLVSTSSFDPPELKPLFYETVDRAIGPKPADAEREAFELVTREDSRGHRYLFVLNPDTREIREAEITVADRFAHCADLGVGSGIPLPASITDKGWTRFRLRLHPGEGTVISLGR